MKYTDRRAVLELARRIVLDTKTIENSLIELDSNLKKFSNYIQDDGFDEISTHLNFSKGILESNIGSFQEIVKQLTQYAELLKKE